jgi:hypothetical protein
LYFYDKCFIYFNNILSNIISTAVQWCVNHVFAWCWLLIAETCSRAENRSDLDISCVVTVIIKRLYIETQQDAWNENCWDNSSDTAVTFRILSNSSFTCHTNFGQYAVCDNASVNSCIVRCVFLVRETCCLTPMRMDAYKYILKAVSQHRSLEAVYSLLSDKLCRGQLTTVHCNILTCRRSVTCLCCWIYWSKNFSHEHPPIFLKERGK